MLPPAAAQQLLQAEFQSSQTLEKVHEGIIDLYLQVKVRSNDEVSVDVKGLFCGYKARSCPVGLNMICYCDCALD